MTTYALGKNFTIKRETSTPGTYEIVSAAKSHDMAPTNAPIDVSNKDGDGWRLLISGGMRSIDANFSGIFTDNAALKAMVALGQSVDPIANFQIVDMLGNKWQGPFHVTGPTLKGDNFKEETYAFKMQSSGAIVFTPAA